MPCSFTVLIPYIPFTLPFASCILFETPITLLGSNYKILDLFSGMGERQPSCNTGLGGLIARFMALGSWGSENHLPGVAGLYLICQSSPCGDGDSASITV